MSDAFAYPVTQAIAEALARWQKNQPSATQPKRIFLGEYAYEKLHDIAEGHEIPAIRHPKFEDDRLEYKGMKIHCHRSASIEFE